MRILTLLALALTCVSAPAWAQTTQQRMPPAYTVYGPGGPTTWYVPNSTGGYTVYGRNGPIKWVVPNSVGGYTVYGPNGPTKWVVPTGPRRPPAQTAPHVFGTNTNPPGGNFTR